MKPVCLDAMQTMQRQRFALSHKRFFPINHRKYKSSDQTFMNYKYTKLSERGQETFISRTVSNNVEA